MPPRPSDTGQHWYHFHTTEYLRLDGNTFTRAAIPETGTDGASARHRNVDTAPEQSQEPGRCIRPLKREPQRHGYLANEGGKAIP